MKGYLRSFVAFITALFPFIGINIVNLFILNENNSFGFQVLFFVILFSSIWLGYFIFNQVKAKGYWMFISKVSASPELDNPKSTKDSEHIVRKAVDLKYHFERGEILCQGGSLRIFGDSFGQLGDHFHRIVGFEYYAFDKRLIIHFNDSANVEITNPISITDSRTYLKILKADEIKFSFLEMSSPYHIKYKHIKNEILVETDWNNGMKIRDTSLGSPALDIFYY